jgi:hypothetical protein
VGDYSELREADEETGPEGSGDALYLFFKSDRVGDRGKETIGRVVSAVCDVGALGIAGLRARTF